MKRKRILTLVKGLENWLCCIIVVDQDLFFKEGKKVHFCGVLIDKLLVKQLKKLTQKNLNKIENF